MFTRDVSPTEKRFEGRVGFILSIDGARLLPANCVAATVPRARPMPTPPTTTIIIMAM